jgi:hypothetical protein
MIGEAMSRINGNAQLVRRGRFVDTAFLLEVGETPWLIAISGGRIVSLTKGPFVMASWTFALRAPAEAWTRFWAERPEPGFHDLFALIKQRQLKAEGDLHVFMANLFYFKELVASLRLRPEA